MLNYLCYKTETGMVSVFLNVRPQCICSVSITSLGAKNTEVSKADSFPTITELMVQSERQTLVNWLQNGSVITDSNSDTEERCI